MSYSILINPTANVNDVKKNTWLVILHATRIPPHIGILIDGKYNSLSIKGQELEIDYEVLLKTIQQKKIETLFIELIHHPVFSTNYQKEIAQHYIKQFKHVSLEEGTCLSPIKLFLQEFYALQNLPNELLFELIERLSINGFIKQTMAINLPLSTNLTTFKLPQYSAKQLSDLIQKERDTYYKK